MRYLLLNKNNVVALGVMESGIEDSLRLTDVTGTLPIGMKSITAWIDNRKASKHNHHLKEIMAECGCDTLSGFIDVTHAASVNDTFWVKREDDPAEWKDISLYTNDFNETISKLAFYGLGIADLKMSSTSPELVTGGSFPKCLKKEKDGIYLYKKGLNHTYNGGLEPYGEVMTGEIASKICSDSVRYNLVNMHGTMASRCRLFTDEKYGYVPMSEVAPNGMSINELYEYMAGFKNGSEERFREMLVCDSVTFNQDRHAGNFGVIIDNDTIKPLGMAPVFDFNLAFFPYVLNKEFENIGDKLLEYGPKLGDDFTRLGQQALTDKTADRLKDIKDFEFSFKGDRKFTKERLDTIHSLINRQIDAVLSKDILYTKDVFIPYKHIEAEKRAESAKTLLDRIYDPLEKLADEKGFFISVTEDENSQMICLEPEDPDKPSLYIDFMSGRITAEKYGQGIPLSSLDSYYMDFIQTAEPYINEKTVVNPLKSDEIAEEDIEKIASLIVENKDKILNKDCDISDGHIKELKEQSRAQADGIKNAPAKNVKNKGGDTI